MVIISQKLRYLEFNKYPAMDILQDFYDWISGVDFYKENLLYSYDFS